MMLSKHSGTVYRTLQLFSLGSAKLKYPCNYASNSFLSSINFNIYYDPSIALILTLSTGSLSNCYHNYNNYDGKHFSLARSAKTPAHTLLTIGVSSPQSYLNKSHNVVCFSYDTCL